VIELGKKSILDGLGLAFPGSVAQMGELGREYIQSIGLSPLRLRAFAHSCRKALSGSMRTALFEGR
jgi:hypothetical protein